MSIDKDVDENVNEDEKQQQQGRLIPIDDVNSQDIDSTTFNQDIINAVTNNAYNIDDRVLIDGANTGCIRFIGINDANILLYGVQLDAAIPTGNDGYYNNIQYIQCEAQHCLFVESSHIQRLSFNYLHKEEEEYVAAFLNDMLSIDDCNQLNVDDVIDHRYERNGTYFEGTIIEKKGTNVKLHYKGAPEEYDTWSDYTQELYRFAKPQSITRHRLSRLLKHEYDKYFKLHRDLDTIYKNLRICLWCIKTRIVPKRKQESRGALAEYLSSVKIKLFEEFLFIKLKQRVNNDIIYAQIVKDFHQMYCSIVDVLAEEDDAFHLQISKDIAERGTNDSNGLSECNKNILKQIKLKWNTIHEERKTDSNAECDDDTCDRYECISIKRVKELLEILQVYFIDIHNEDENNGNRIITNNIDNNELDFISIFNHLSYNYGIIDAINDFNHIKSHHIAHIAESEYLIPGCEHEVCILNKRIVENNRDIVENNQDIVDNNRDIVNHYFGFTLSEEINIMKFWIKLHVFISHRQCLLEYKENKVKVAPINKKSTKFVTTVLETEEKKDIDTQNDENKNKKSTIRMSKFEFGQQFFYKKYFEKEQDRYYIAQGPYHDNLKEELLKNNIHPLRMDMFHSQLLRAQNLVLSNGGKRMKALNKGINNVQYEVPVGAPISMAQMLCILIYTNLTNLQCEFKKIGCRKVSHNDTMDDTAERNRQIGHWYQLFMETVLIYGQFTTKKDIFYHGLSVKLLFSSFNPIFKCPISTTTEFHVAQTFASYGIILELTSIATSGDSYLDVSWISNFPEEYERLFSFARNLTISNIRFMESNPLNNNRIEFKHTHKDHLCALRLFDSIFKSNSAYKRSILNARSQYVLMLYIANYRNIIANNTFMDQLYIFNIKTALNDFTEHIRNEEYDSDAVWSDLNENNSISCILRYVGTRNNDKLSLFQEFIESQKILRNIPQYLMDLFCFMVNSLKEQDDIFMIESEYNKLDNGLRNALRMLKLPEGKCIQEFEWKIENADLQRFQGLGMNEHITGPEFVFNEKQIIIVPQIKRSAIEWRNNCEIGIRMTQNTSDNALVKVSWSFLVKETNYSMKEHYVTLKLQGYNGYKSFSNKSVNDKQCLTLTFFIRLY